MPVGCWLRYAASQTAVLSLLLLTATIAAVSVAASEPDAPQAPSFRTEEVITSPEDTRSYRSLVYDNGLQVLLVHDPEANEAEWALSVLAGANQDPAALPGLNHLLALVLYEDPAVSVNVQPEHTEYYARSAMAELVPSLQQFVAQVDRPDEFSVDEVERAQHLLASKIRAGLGATLTDRRNDVFSALFNVEHPMARRQGASASIAQLPVVSGALQNNYRRYYSPARMCLTLVANLPLAEQQPLVSQVLTPLAVKTSVATAELDYPPLFAPQTLPLEVHIQADTAKPQLQLLFPVPNPLSLYAEKPLAEVSRLLTDGGPGSLLALLKRLGWAEAIDTGMGMQSRYDGLYEVRIDLTDLGMRATDQVVALVFYMLEQIRWRGLQSWRHDELARTAALDFRYRDAAAVRDPAQLAHALHYYRPGDVLYGPYRFNEYNERLVRRYLDFLRSNNVLISVTSAAEVEGEQRSPVLLTPYSAVQASEAQPDIKIAVRRRLEFPKRNNFIPQRLNAKEPPMLPVGQNSDLSKLVELFNKPRSQAWFSRAQVATPVASVLLRLEIPAAGDSARSATQAELLAEMMAQELNEKMFAAHLAGADFTFQPHALGVDIQVHGYNSQLGLMLTHIGKMLSGVDISERRFKQARNALAERLNAPQNTLDGLLRERISRLHYRPSWSRAERAAVLPSLTPEQLRDFKHDHYRVARLNVLLYGNLYRQEAQRLAALSEHYFLSGDAPPARTASYGRLGDTAGVQMSLPAVDGAALYLQGQGASATDLAQLQLAAQLLRESLRQAQLNRQSITDQLSLEAESSAAAETDQLVQPPALQADRELNPLRSNTDELGVAIDPAQVVVLDWQLAGRPALVVYYAGSDGAGDDPNDVTNALRGYVKQELTRRWPEAAVADAKTLIKQRLASNRATGERALSVALWHELLDGAVANKAIAASVAEIKVSSSEQYRQALARRIAGALTLGQRKSAADDQGTQQELLNYWRQLQKQPLYGPVLP